MLWGNGDTGRLTDRERETLADLRRLVETGHLVGLTPEQAQTVLSAIKFYAAISATSGLLAGSRNVLVFLGSILLMWWTAKDAIIEFIKKAAGG